MSYNNPYNLSNPNQTTQPQPQQQQPLPFGPHPAAPLTQQGGGAMQPPGLPTPMPMPYPAMPPYGMMPGPPLVPNAAMVYPSGYPGFLMGGGILMQPQQQQQGPGNRATMTAPAGVMPHNQMPQYLASTTPSTTTSGPTGVNAIPTTIMKTESLAGPQLGSINSSNNNEIKGFEVDRCAPGSGSGGVDYVKADPNPKVQESSHGPSKVEPTMKEEDPKDKPAFKELTLDDLVAPPGPACALDDPKLKAAYDYCDTTTAAVIDVAIRQATALCERGIEEQFEVAEAELRVAMIEAEMEAYKAAMAISKDPSDIENKRRRVAIYGGTLSPTQSPRDTGQASPESPDTNVWGGGLSAGQGRNNSPEPGSLHSADQDPAKPTLPPRFGGGVRHHRRAHLSTGAANMSTPENGSPAISPPSTTSTDSSPAE